MGCAEESGGGSRGWMRYSRESRTDLWHLSCRPRLPWRSLWMHRRLGHLHRGPQDHLRAFSSFLSTLLPPMLTSSLRTSIQANAGDSRAVMSLGGEAKPLSFDHKPTNKGETSRIVAAGGFVEFGRVNGESLEPHFALRRTTSVESRAKSSPSLTFFSLSTDREPRTIARPRRLRVQAEHNP